MNKVLNLLGLAKRAGKLIYGTDAIIDQLPKKEIKIIFVASDASNQTIDKLEKKAFYYEVQLNKEFTTEELNHACGLSNIKVIGVKDKGFADSINKSL